MAILAASQSDLCVIDMTGSVLVVSVEATHSPLYQPPQKPRCNCCPGLIREVSRPNGGKMTVRLLTHPQVGLYKLDVIRRLQVNAISLFIYFVHSRRPFGSQNQR